MTPHLGIRDGQDQEVVSVGPDFLRRHRDIDANDVSQQDVIEPVPVRIAFIAVAVLMLVGLIVTGFYAAEFWRVVWNSR